MREPQIRRSPPVNKPPFLFTPFTMNKGVNVNGHNQLKSGAFTHEQRAVHRPRLFTCSPLSLSKESGAVNGVNARFGRVE